MEEDETYFRYGEWEVRGWKANALGLAVGTILFGAIFLAGYLVGATT